MKRYLRILILSIMKKIPPILGLSFLLHLDNWIYYFLSQQAIYYNQGVHPKHRLTKYHDFFIERIQPGERVIDIGCGIGAVTYDIAENAGAYVLGIDMNPALIDEAVRKHHHPRAEYLYADIQEDQIEGDFDVVVMSNILEHLADRSVLIHRLQNKLNPSRWLIRVPLYDRDLRVPLKKEIGIEWRLDPTHEIEYTIESFIAEIKQAELKINHLEVHWSEIWAEVNSLEGSGEKQDK